MKTILSCLLLQGFVAFSFAQNLELVSHLPYTQELADIWGYVVPDGTEYALVGAENGVSIVSLADVKNPVEVTFIEGANSIWRDIKTFGHFAYAVTGSGEDGLLVIDLSGLPQGVTYKYWNIIPGQNKFFNYAHNLWIDEFGYGYLAGSNLVTPVDFLDLFSTPGQPKYIGRTFSGHNVHDLHVRNNTMYVAEPLSQQFSLYDVTDKTNPVLLASSTVPGGYAHSLWLSDDSKYLFVSDEKSPFTSSFDISNNNNIRLLDIFQMPELPGVNSIPHNPHVINNFVVISHYIHGLVIVDALHPDNLIKVGQYLTGELRCGSAYTSAWGAYPYLPSGNIIISDIEKGLFVLRPTWQRACYLEGKITDAASGNPVPGASIKILSEDYNDGQTNLDGIFKTGQLTPGEFEVVIHAAGFEEIKRNVLLTNGQITALDLQIRPLRFPSFGKILDKTSGNPVAGAKVRIDNQEVSHHFLTDENGRFTFPGNMTGDFTVHAGKWGYRPAGLKNPYVPEGEELLIELETGYEDNFSLDLGWTVTGDATKGVWERGKPNDFFQWTYCKEGTPREDWTGDFGNDCFATGLVYDVQSNGNGGPDFVKGKTILVSPPLKLKSNYIRPQLDYYTWFTVTGNSTPPNDSLIIWIDNGKEKVILNFITINHRWQPSPVFNLADFIELTDSMYFIFQVENVLPSHYLEAALDHFHIREGLQDEDFNAGDEAVRLRIFPNPFSSQLTIDYKVKEGIHKIEFLAFNILGQAVEQRKIDAPIGTINFQPDLPAGTYLVAFKLDGKLSAVTKVVKGS